uniref:Uncharacterized protein n=1 Tax=Oryza nivara TaxID=4536 RepID=A0A0E0IPG4_ORYNI
MGCLRCSYEPNGVWGPNPARRKCRQGRSCQAKDTLSEISTIPPLSTTRLSLSFPPSLALSPPSLAPAPAPLRSSLLYPHTHALLLSSSSLLGSYPNQLQNNKIKG